MALEIAEPLELSEQVVERLLADPELRGEGRGPHPVGAGILEDGQVRALEVVEAMLVRTVALVPPHDLERPPQQRTDEGRPHRRLGLQSKAT